MSVENQQSVRPIHPPKSAASLYPLCVHKATGQAYIRVRGKRRYLGRADAPGTQQKYHQAVSELLANGGEFAAPTDALSVGELIARYWVFAETYYRAPDGSLAREVENIRRSLRVLCDLFSETPVASFGPRALMAVRQAQCALAGPTRRLLLSTHTQHNKTQRRSAMSLLSQVQVGKLHTPRRLMVYGVQGVGKSTFAAQAPKPIFIPTEEGVKAQPIAGPLCVSIDLYPPDNRRRDCDNAMKALLDALQHGRAYHDDSQITWLLTQKAEVYPGGKAVVRIWQRGFGSEQLKQIEDVTKWTCLPLNLN